MAKLNISVGISDFSEIRQNQYYYVDKSGLIRQLTDGNRAKVTLITRPRRFGKTLGMSMLENFFNIQKDSKDLFYGLEISKDAALCHQWMNQYPTIFLTLKDIDGLSFEDAYGQLMEQIADLYKEHVYLLDCDTVDPDDMQIFLDLKAGKADKTKLSRSLAYLMKLMHHYYQKPVILLLDEYDVPLAKASSHGYYDEMLSILKIMMSTAFKDNSDLLFAVITGCLKIAKESIFTGTNNFVSDTISSSRLNEFFGFTQSEVNQILKDADCIRHASEVKQWYDGYHFGNFDIYCPWDVMNYLRDLQQNPMIRPSSYWKNTSDNAIIRSFIDQSGSSISQKLEKLLFGGYIVQQIDENLTYDYLHSSENNLWSILYLTGYLTRVPDAEIEFALPIGSTALMIPNAEIREIYESTIMQWFNDYARSWDRNNLFQAAWMEDTDTLTAEMNRLLRQTISYHDYREDFYHAFLAGIFAGAGYMVESNREHGEGRSDIVISDLTNSKIIIFEAKYAKSVSTMEADCEKALEQINTRMYAAEYEDDYDQIICYGIAFYKKRCLVKKAE